MAKLKEARGRGNQGDHVAPQHTPPQIPPAIKAHNDNIEAKRRAKLAVRRERQLYKGG
jgi:hypothetical protein